MAVAIRSVLSFAREGLKAKCPRSQLVLRIALIMGALGQSVANGAARRRLTQPPLIIVTCPYGNEPSGWPMAQWRHSVD
jgi:hypothetical protein